MKTVIASPLLAVTVMLPRPSPETARVTPHIIRVTQCIRPALSRVRSGPAGWVRSAA